MKYVFTIILLLPLSLFSFERDDGHYQIDTSVLRKCNKMIDDLNEKIVLKRRILYLLKKNEKMVQWTPKNKKSILEKLRFNNNELYFFILKVENKIRRLEEKIALRYCPGIILDDLSRNLEIDKIFSLEKEILEKEINDHYGHF